MRRTLQTGTTCTQNARSVGCWLLWFGLLLAIAHGRSIDTTSTLRSLLVQQLLAQRRKLFGSTAWKKQTRLPFNPNSQQLADTIRKQIARQPQTFARLLRIQAKAQPWWCMSTEMELIFS